MTNLLMSSRLFSLGGHMTITDEQGNTRYTVKGSFLRAPKQFRIYTADGVERAKVVHKMVSILPKFFLQIDGQKVAQIAKKFTIFRPKYKVHGHGISVDGNLLDMNFRVMRDGQEIGWIDKKWVSIHDKYRITVLNNADDLLVLGLVLAVNYVKQQERSVSD